MRGVAGGRGRGACRGLASGRGRGVAGGAGQRVRADTGASSRDLRPGRVGQGKEEMEIGWGGRRGEQPWPAAAAGGWVGEGGKERKP